MINDNNNSKRRQVYKKDKMLKKLRTFTTGKGDFRHGFAKRPAFCIVLETLAKDRYRTRSVSRLATA